MKEIKNINKESLAKITAMIYGLAGFFMGLTLAAATAVNIIMKHDFQGSVALVTLFNMGEGFILAVLTALATSWLGLAVGYITAAIYNWFAKSAGGIKLELGEAVEVKKQAKQEKGENQNGK